MKRILMIVLLFVSGTTFSQDLIVKMNGDTIKCKVGGEMYATIKYEVDWMKLQLKKDSVKYFVKNGLFYIKGANNNFKKVTVLPPDYLISNNASNAGEKSDKTQLPPANMTAASEHLIKAMNHHYAAVGCYGGASVVGLLAITASDPSAEKTTGYIAGLVGLVGFIIDIEAWSHFGKASKAMQDNRISFSDAGVGIKLRF
jgi:ribosomal protein S11